MSHDEDPTPAQSEGAAVRAGDFERYGLVAALTLIVLSLIAARRVSGAAAAAPPPERSRLLRIELGGPARRPGPGSAERRAPAQLPGGGAAVEPAPEPPQPPDLAPPPLPGPRTYVVQAGDSLGSIASRELGTTRRAGEIAALNGIADPDRVRAGTTLTLPAR